MAKNIKGIVPGRKLGKSKPFDLKQPSWKWLICRKCNFNEVKVSVETIKCICSLCLTMACPYTPAGKVAPKTTREKKVGISTFAKRELEDKEQADLAKAFSKKKSDLKDGNVPSKPKKRKTTKKKKITKKKKRKYTKRKK